METGIQLPTNARFQFAWPSHERAAILSDESMNRTTGAQRAIVIGLLITLAQIFVTVALIAPAGAWHDRYHTLIQHDSYWFANIVDRGYGTIVPPIDHKLMEVSNVAFFPAYPGIARVLHSLGLETYDALLVTAQLAAWGFWTYFFLLCQRWNISPVRQILGGIAIAAHPTAFFLIAGYSESLFLAMLLGFVYWSGAQGRAAKVIAALHGMLMSATRIVGIPCAAFPVVRTIFEGGWKQLRDVRNWFRNYGGAVALMFAAMLGAIGFFLYCQLRWGVWNLYMQTQEAGWAILPDYLAVLKPASYHWLIPPLNDPTLWSQMTMTVGALLFLVVALCEFVPAVRRRTQWQSRVGLYFVAVTTYYIAVSGVASVAMESMLRYQFCAHVLIVLALLHFLAQLRPPPLPARALGMAVVALICAAGLSLQGWWIWNFTRGGWVA